MGRIYLPGPDGRERASAFFGADAGYHNQESQIENDGTITDVEISFARESLEAELNRRICGYGGPLGLGGWGGINEVCAQPWNLGGPSREETPDGYSMPVTLRLSENYRVPVAYVFSEYRRTEREVEMTMRWESGRIRLYQATPPPYAPPPPPPPPPDIIQHLEDTGAAVAEGLRSFFGEVEVAAGAVTRSWHRFFS